MARRPVEAHELRQYLDDAARPNPAGNVDRQALAGELVNDRQALQRAAIGAGVEHKVVRPHVIDAGGRERTGAAGRHAPARPFPRHLQLLLAPQAIPPISAEHMALAFKKDPDGAIAVPRILRGQRRIGNTTSASRAISRDVSPSVERATERRAHARRRDRPRPSASETCCRRTRAPTIFFG
jgi:hypothetical protein